jgi:UDP-N-acetylglucosamine transferase subunit ALG13
VNQDPRPPKILVAPLDWGLGHATRCVPVIQALLRQKANVVLAACGSAKTLLQQEFPQLPLVDLPGYEIEYATTSWGLAVKIVAQIPKLLSAIKEEHAWLQKVVAEERIDAVISDNRYGLHHPEAWSVFITHQLRIKAPLQIAEDILQEENYRFINRFDECWVPDAEGGGNLAGELSHPARKPAIPLRYLGSLSRFEKTGPDTGGNHLFILLSGPEPQRTMLEEQLFNELKEYTKPVLFVRGLPGQTELPTLGENIIVHNHLPAVELEQKLRDASMIIGRCGYSTVMDLAALQKQSILIPTPGQTEQEYLSSHLMQKNFALCIDQKKFRLKHALALAENFPYQTSFCAEKNLEEVIKSFVQRIKTGRKTASEQPT